MSSNSCNFFLNDSIFSFFTEEETRSSYYRANIPFCLDFTTLHPETDIPFLMTVTAPDFFLHTSLNQKEFEQLTATIEQLTEEQRLLHNLFNSGEQISDVESKAARYKEISDMLDEMELRWLELSEKD